MVYRMPWKSYEVIKHSWHSWCKLWRLASHRNCLVPDVGVRDQADLASNVPRNDTIQNRTFGLVSALLRAFAFPNVSECLHPYNQLSIDGARNCAACHGAVNTCTPAAHTECKTKLVANACNLQVLEWGRNEAPPPSSEQQLQSRMPRRKADGVFASVTGVTHANRGATRNLRYKTLQNLGCCRDVK